MREEGDTSFFLYLCCNKMNIELQDVVPILAERGFFLQDERLWTGSLPSFLCPRLQQRFLLVPAGAYLRGSDGPFADPDEGPVREVSITQPFLLADTPCSQASWRKGIEGTGLCPKIEGLAASANFPVFGTSDDMPVYHVSWTECVRWCEANDMILPTEAQWEYACRAGSSSEFSFGDFSMDDLTGLSGKMWFSEHNYSECPKLGALAPNTWGFFDMHGSVWEWCQDLYDAEYYRVGTVIDPCNTTTGQRRVHRGGAWDVPAICCRSSARYRDEENYRLGSIGFRAAATLCIR